MKNRELSASKFQMLDLNKEQERMERLKRIKQGNLTGSKDLGDPT